MWNIEIIQRALIVFYGLWATAKRYGSAMRSVALSDCTCTLACLQDIFIKISDCKSTLLYNSLLLLFRLYISMLCLASFTLSICRLQAMSLERCDILNISCWWRFNRSYGRCSIHHLRGYRGNFSYLWNTNFLVMIIDHFDWIKQISRVFNLLFFHIHY